MALAPEFVVGQVTTKKMSIDSFARLMPTFENAAIGKKIVATAITSSEANQLNYEDSLSVLTASPIRFAFPRSVTLNAQMAGAWSFDGQFNYWRLDIESKGAKSLSVTFDDLSLPSQSEFWLFSQTNGWIGGPYNSNNFPTGKPHSYTDPIFGETLTLLYKEPSLTSEP